MEIHKIHVPNHQPAIILIKDIQEIFRILWLQIRHYHEALGPWNPWDSPGMLCIVYSQDVDAAWHASTEVGVPNDSLNDHDLLWFSMILYWKQPWWLGDPAWLKKPARYIYIYMCVCAIIYIICLCICKNNTHAVLGHDVQYHAFLESKWDVSCARAKVCVRWNGQVFRCFPCLANGWRNDGKT